MESFFSRYRNLIVLLAVLLAQVIGLAVQVRKPLTAGPGAAGGPAVHETKDGRGVMLIRLWSASLVTPFERAIHGSGEGLNGLWGEYVDLRHVKNQNKELQQTIDLRTAGRLDDALAIVDRDGGKQTMTEIRQVISAMRAEEVRVLEARSTHAEFAASRSLK